MNPFRSIKNKLLIFVLCVSFIPIAVITTIYYLNARNALKYQVLEKLRAVAESRRWYILSFMEVIKTRTADFSADEFIKNSLKTIAHGDVFKPGAVKCLNKHLSVSKMPLNHHLIGIILVDKYGKVISSTNKKLMGKDMSDYDAFVQGMRKGYGETYVGQPCYSSYIDGNCILISAPIISRRHAELLGVIINVYHLAVLDEIISGRLGMGETGEVYLINRGKLMLTKSRFINNAPLKQMIDIEAVRMIGKDSKETIDFYQGYRGVPVVGILMDIPAYGWALLAEMDNAEVFAPLRTLGITAFILGIVSAAVVTSLGIVFAVSLSSPIKNLVNATEILARGNLRYRVHITRQDEIGALGNSFNVMAEELERRIIEQKRVEEALRRGEASLANAQRIAHVGNWEWDIGKNTVHWSDEVYRIFGLSPQTFRASYEAFLNTVHPDDREYVKKSIHEALYEGKPFIIDHRIPLPDGTVHFAHCQGEVVYDTTGNAIQMNGTIQDVTELKKMEEELRALNESLEQRVAERTAALTRANEELQVKIAERKQAEDALRMSESKYRLLLENLPQRIFYKDKNLTYVSCNENLAKDLQIKPDEIGGKTDYDFFPRELAEKYRAEDKRVMESGQTDDREEEYIKEGKELIVRMVRTPIKDEKGNILGILGAFLDITEKIILQREAERSRHLASLGELAAGVAHEINNPITGVINCAQILLNKGNLRDKEKDICNRIMKEGDRIATIVSKLLSFARPGDKKERTRVSLYEILSDTLILTGAQLRKEGIKVRLHIPKRLPEVLVHPQQIQQVFMNLIHNARYALNQKYPETHDNKILEISGEEITMDDSPYIKITFYDHGAGIPLHIRDKIVNPFFTTKPTGKGTGLGLYISHNIINEHGGRLMIDSIEGKFTKIAIILPAFRVNAISITNLDPQRETENTTFSL